VVCGEGCDVVDMTAAASSRDARRPRVSIWAASVPALTGRPLVPLRMLALEAFDLEDKMRA
jgi:hypothetical protein